MKTGLDQAGDDAPLPLAQFKRFVAVFHFVFVAGIIFSLVLRWRRPEFSWSWRDTALVGIVTAQIGLYVLFMVRIWKPPTATAWWLGYFFSGYALWLMEWRLEPVLQWTAWAYLGQMFGVLRPVFSMPFALTVFVTWLTVRVGPRALLQMSFLEWVGSLILVTSATGLGLFLYRLTSTSSERARLIQRLEAAQRELEQARQRDAELAVLRERERLARDLHDSLGHGLSTLSIQLEAAQRLYSVDPGRASVLLDEMKVLTRGCMEQLRRALAGLRAPGLGEEALIAAVRKFCKEIADRGQIQVDCELPSDGESLPVAVAEALWRVVQEGLANAEKHAHATRVRVCLELTPGQALIRVADNGIGMPLDGEARSGHYGLRGLRERVEGLGGVFSVQAAPPKGTLVQAQIPLLPK